MRTPKLQEVSFHEILFLVECLQTFQPSTFLLPLSIGTCQALGGNLMTDAFRHFFIGLGGQNGTCG